MTRRLSLIYASRRERPQASSHPAFAREIGANLFVGLATGLLSARTRLRARRRHVRYSFLFTRASGEQLRAIAALVDAGTISTVVDEVFPFESTKELS